MRQRIIGCLLAVACICLGSHTGTAQVTNYKAYAVFVYSFSKYVHWPSASNQGDFVVAVVGKSKIVDELQIMASRKTVNNRAFVIKQIDHAADLDQAHLVFVSEGRSGAIDEIVRQTEGTPTLIVTEREGLIRKGASISFITLEDKSLRFELNEANLQARRLQIAKSLLALAYQE